MGGGPISSWTVSDSRTKTYDDFLEIVLNARDDDGSPLSDQDILDNVNTFVFAGQYVLASY